MTERQRRLLEGICDEFERTIAYFDWKQSGSKWMNVPFHGDFVSVATFPGIVNKMRWWVREFRSALDEDKE